VTVADLAIVTPGPGAA